MWRCLASDETFVYTAELDSWHGTVRLIRREATLGYCIPVQMFLWGHSKCECVRGKISEMRYMFREQEAQCTHFPVHPEVKKEWLREIQRDGWNAPELPGFIVGFTQNQPEVWNGYVVKTTGS